MREQELSTPSIDPIGDILKWVLLAVAVICFGLMVWATVLTYEKAPPHPQAFTDRSGRCCQSNDNLSLVDALRAGL